MLPRVYISPAGIGSSTINQLYSIKKWLRVPPAIYEKNQVKPLQAIPNAEFEGCSLLVPFVYEIVFVVIKLVEKIHI